MGTFDWLVHSQEWVEWRCASTEHGVVCVAIASSLPRLLWCADNSLGSLPAQVRPRLCALAVWCMPHSKYTGPQVLTGSQINITSGPIFLDQLQCTGKEARLVDCRAGVLTGLVTCTNADTVGAVCQGEGVMATAGGVLLTSDFVRRHQRVLN